MELKELHEKIQENWAQMKAHMDEQQKEIKATGDKSAEIQKTIDTYSAKINEFETAIKSLQAAASRPALGSPFEASRSSKERLQSDERKKYELFFRVLRSGVADLDDPQERKEFRDRYMVKRGSDFDERQTTDLTVDREGKALALGDETAGGYLAPPEFVQDIIKGVQLISPVRPLANIRNTSRRSVQYPVRQGVFAAKWTSETGTRTETAGLAFALEEVPNHEMYALIFVSDQDLEDSVFNLEQEILDNATEQFAKAEGAAFVNGSAVGQPEGFMTNPNVASSTTATGAGAVLQAKTLIQIWGDIKTAYAKDATWLMNRQTIAAARGLVDGQGRYLWEPGLSDGTPPNLLGSPYVEIPDMPNIAASSFPILYGNLKRAYLIVDRINVVVRRLQEKYAESGQVAYLVRKRVGGQVVLPEAIRKLQIPAS